jgi:hypothetical protein
MKYRVHRVAWVFTNGSIPKGMMVLHKCDNRKCVNPDHLYLGTHCDNMKDVVDRGLSGLGNGCTRFYAGEIYLIRKLKIVKVGIKHNTYKFSATFISKMFKCAPQTIINIWNSDKYKCREGYYV